jgi:hypothetical protein
MEGGQHVTTTPPAPTLTAFTDADPCPRVEVVVTPMPGDADTITVWRTWKGQRSAVRDAQNAEVAGDFLIVDYEAPFGTPVTYTCQTADVSGIPSDISAGSATTVSVDDMWLQDALDPASSMPVSLEIGTAASGYTVIAPSIMPATYQADVSTIPVHGDELPVGLGGVRRAASRMPWSVIAWTPTDAESLRTLLKQAYPLCVRTPSLVHQLSGLTYLSLSDLVETPYPGWTATRFEAAADSVKGPGAGIVIQPRTYAQLLDEAATYTALKALYATYLDVRRGL